jgi:hypothetical protein
MSIWDAVRLTEAEIMAEATGDYDETEGNPAYLNMPEGDGPDEWLEGTEGFDGEPLGDEEQFATASGDVPDGYLGDRPLQFMREQELMRELEWRRQHHDDNDKLGQDLIAIDERQRADAERMQIAQHFIDRGMAAGHAEEAAQQVWGLEQQRRDAVAQVASVGTNRLEASFRAAERDYGGDFIERAHWLNDLTNLANRGDQVAAATVRAIINQPDPGHALMEWETASPHQPPPFMGGRRSAGQSSRQSGLSYEDLEAASGGGSEEDIFNSAVGDSRDNPYWQDFGG